MKPAAMLSAILLVSVAGDGMACSTPSQRLDEAQIRSFLSGKRILATAPGGETWHEDHCSVAGANGPANLYKVGVEGSKVDPRALRGTWQIVTTGTGPQATSTVTYTYFRHPPASNPATNLGYTWSLWQRPGNPATSVIDFCDAGKLVASFTPPAPAAGTPCS